MWIFHFDIGKRIRCGSSTISLWNSVSRSNLFLDPVDIFSSLREVVEYVVELVVEFPQPIAKTQMASVLPVVELPLWNFHNSLGPLLRGPKSGLWKL